MPEEATPAPDNSSINATINAVAGLAQAIPVYQDALQPAAKEVGKSLEVVGKVVNIALAPLRGMVWGYEKIEGFITERVGEKLKNVPPENIVTPAANVVGPAIEALKFSGEDVNLRELYANLMANAMDKSTSGNTHPAFVDIIKSLSSDEALMLQYLNANDYEPLLNISLTDKDTLPISQNLLVVHYNLIAKKSGVLAYEDDLLISSYLNNLCRIGIMEITHGFSLSREGAYDEVESAFAERKAEIIENHPKKNVLFVRGLIKRTNFGHLFFRNVVTDKS